MDSKEILFLILAIIFFIFIIKRSKNKPSLKETSNVIEINNTFTPYKIVENDNTLRDIVENYEIRENNKKIEIEKKLGKALPNDIIWGILQDLYIDVGTQRIWPARAFTLGHLTHNDLATVRI